MGQTLLLILLGLFIALLVLPAGAELTWTGGERRLLIIAWGIRMPVPYKLFARIRWVTRKLFRKAKREAKSGRMQSRILQWLKAAGHGPGTSPFELEIEDLREGYRFVKQILRRVKIKVHQFDAVIATSDPALTGMAYGWAWAARSWLPQAWPIHLDVDFAGSKPEVDMKVEFSAIPARLIGFGLHYFGIGLWRKLRRRQFTYNHTEAEKE